ncbi:MAG TPA: sodium:solute symporter [Clostridia bacterium]|jgi:SSS family solute:Na+ symporter|nr:sodium:solute symporter [Clostridiaceae bacterium]HOM34557.1 sodium:solute symporter [Clostridia bacterium]HOT70195.1 sodium:solute symporter [Clostridia bacterium]HQG00100.1 sodium:solute symporter [Clostridia bacterium]HQH65389.1 sodium:solute symporter [Clostridia bacterium]
MIKIIIIAIFIAIQVAVGIYSVRKIKNIDDFLLGGRKMGAWLSALAYGTSYFSAVIFIGYAGGIGWEMGTSAVWIGIGNAVAGSYLAWRVLAKRTRSITRELDAKTMPEFFQKRYDSEALKIFTSVLTFIFLVPYTASVYKGLGYLFSKLFPASVSVSQAFTITVIIMAAFTLIYLVLGGYIATALNNLIQGTIMIIGTVIIVVYVVKSPEVNGFANGLASLNNIKEGLGTITGPDPWKLLSLVLITSFGVWGLPQMVHKFYAIKDESSIKKGTIIATVFAAVIGIGAYLTGSFGRLFFSEIPNGSVDTIVPNMLVKILPDAFLGIFMVLILAASMSTLSSLVLVSASSISVDLVKGYIKKDMSEKSQLTLFRILCGVFVVISVIMALMNNNAIVTLMNLSWGTLAGCFLGPYVVGIYSRRADKVSAFAGMLSGFTVMMTLVIIKGMTYSTVAGCIAMATSVAVSFIVSRLSWKKNITVEEILNEKVVTGE